MKWPKNILLFILSIGNTEIDSQRVKRQKGFLIYMGLLMSCGGFLWGGVSLYYELYLAATVPYTYILITLLNFSYLYKTKKFEISKNIQIFISLVLPFFFQYFLGGFIASGGNVLWSVLAVFGSFTLRNKNASVVWLAFFIAIVVLSGVVDESAHQYAIGLSESTTILFFVINFIVTISIIFTLYYYFVSSEEKVREELQNSLDKLQLAQEELIVSEKMASLGSLVSGVAHEINTPLGVGISGVSQISHEIQEVRRHYESNSLTEEALLHSVETIGQLTQTVSERLSNAATLVKSFKSISTDQHFEDKREFGLKNYLQDLVLSLHTPLKSKSVKVGLKVDDTIVLESFPGIFSQIFSNLILNSLKHGFEQNSDNRIKIEIHLENSCLYMHYEDNGYGISSEVEKKMFDPFFTTKRGEGGSGLGMNIVYNLVTQKLGGEIEILKISPHGLGFDIKLDNIDLGR